ncbi:MAG: NUDIX domain-containing protein [Pseudomonadota bacterium]
MLAKIRDRLFHVWFLIRRPMTLGVRAIALNADNHVMLVKHTYVPGWHLPGGGVEIGETAIDCLARELAEEANIELGETPVLAGFYFNRNASKRDHVALYLCRAVNQSRAKEPDREIVAAAFFDPAALPADISKATARRIEEWRSGSVPASFW